MGFVRGRAGIDEVRRRGVEPTPVGDGVWNELGDVVLAQELRDPVGGHELVEQSREVVGDALAIDADGEALSSERLLAVGQLQLLAVSGLVELEVERQDGVRNDG